MDLQTIEIAGSNFIDKNGSPLDDDFLKSLHFYLTTKLKGRKSVEAKYYIGDAY